MTELIGPDYAGKCDYVVSFRADALGNSGRLDAGQCRQRTPKRIVCAGCCRRGLQQIWTSRESHLFGRKLCRDFCIPRFDHCDRAMDGHPTPVRSCGWWVLATTVGFVAGVASLNPVAAFVSLRVPFGDELTWSIVVSGIVCGFLTQWFVLRRWVGHSVWWVFASAVGWMTAILLLFIMTWMLEGGLKLTLLATFAGGALYGSITGVTLAWLSRRAILGRGFEVNFPSPQRKAEG